MAIYKKKDGELVKVAIGKVVTDSTLSGDGTSENTLKINTSSMTSGKQYAMTTEGWAESDCSDDTIKTVKVGEVDVSATSPEDSITIEAGSNVSLSGDAANKKITVSAANAYNKVKVGNVDIDADDTSKAVTFAAGDNITLTPDTATKTVTIASTGGGMNYKTVQVGETQVSATVKEDTIILTAGNNVGISADATKKEVTVSANPSFDTVTVGTTSITATDNNKSITIAAGANVTVEADADKRTVTISADKEDKVTVSAGTGIKVEEDSTTVSGTTDYKVSLGNELGYFGGTVTDIAITQTEQNLLDGISVSDMVMTNDNRFIIRDGYLYVLAVDDNVQGVDMFTVTYNGQLSRTPSDGYYYLNDVRIQRIGETTAIVRGTDYYSSQTGSSFISISTTIKNTNTVYSEFGGLKYYGYSLTYFGEAPNAGETGMTMTYRISAVEEVVGIAEVGGGSATDDGKISYQGETPAYWDSKVECQYPISSALSSTNKIEVKLSSGTGTSAGMVMALKKGDDDTLSPEWVEAPGEVSGCNGEVRVDNDDSDMGFLADKLVGGTGIKIETVDTSTGKVIAINSDTSNTVEDFAKLNSDTKIAFEQSATFSYDSDSQTLSYGIGTTLAGSANPMTNVFIIPISLPSGKISSMSVLSTKSAETYSGTLYATIGFFGADVDDCAQATAWGEIALCEHDKTSNLFKLSGIEDQELAGEVYYKKDASDEWSDRKTSNTGMSLAAKKVFNWIVVGFSYNSTNSIDYSIAGLHLATILQDTSAFAQHRGMGILGSPTNQGLYHDGRAMSETMEFSANQQTPVVPYIQFNIVRDDA